MKFQDVLAGVGMLILAYLVLINYKGAVALLSSGSSASTGIIRTLQGR